MAMKTANNVGTTLAQSVNPADTQITVSQLYGANNFPALAAGDYFYATLENNQSNVREVVKVTNVALPVLTVTRAQDGTTAQAFSIGDKCEVRLVAAMLNDLPKLDEPNIFQKLISFLFGINVTGNSSITGTLGVSALLTASGGVALPDGSTVASAAPFSFRNRLRNGNFSVNQRQVSGVVNLAAGAYGFDGWKAGAAGCTFSFASSGIDTVITITAGSLLQIVEGAMVEGGAYTLSQKGTAQARIAINGAATSGAYAACPITTAAATAGQTVTVEFTTGTLDRVQLESGSTVTSFERRQPRIERDICLYYYQQAPFPLLTNYLPSAGNAYQGFPHLGPMRAAPSASIVTAPSYVNGNTVTINGATNASNATWQWTVPAAGNTQVYGGQYALSAEL